MEAKELQIGDWVFDERFNKYHKVDLENDFHFICSGETCFKPIPLTPEILEKIGFELCEGSNYEWCAYIKDGVVSYIVYVTPLRSKMSIEIADTGHVIFDWFVDSIHQMQHALRLYGLNELADNLKV